MTFPLLSPDMKSEFELRLTKVRTAMCDAKCDALLLASTVNLFYLTGGVCRGYFYLPLEGEPIFFMTAPAEPVSQLCIQVRKPEEISAWIKRTPAVVGLETEDLYYSEFMRLAHVFTDSKISDASAPMRRARMTKTAHELYMMRQDGMRQCAVYSRIASCWREDMTDLEFQIEIERLLRLEGNLGYLRVAGPRMEINMGSVLAGPNADAPSPYDFSMGGAGTDPSLPVGACGEIMKPGMSVMVDMNGGFNGYQTDMTRTWLIGEALDDKQLEKAKRAHCSSVEILHALSEYALPGAEIGQMYRIAHSMAEDAGLGANFMGHRHKVKFIGHGVGIELNEQPVVMERNRGCLEENMTLALEPKFVLPGIGALGIENTYVVTPQGLENLTPMDETLGQLL